MIIKNAIIDESQNELFERGMVAVPLDLLSNTQMVQVIQKSRQDAAHPQEYADELLRFAANRDKKPAARRRSPSIFEFVGGTARARIDPRVIRAISFEQPAEMLITSRPV